jgi:hypothetical protein
MENTAGYTVNRYWFGSGYCTWTQQKTVSWPLLIHGALVGADSLRPQRPKHTLLVQPGLKFDGQGFHLQQKANVNQSALLDETFHLQTNHK